MWMLVLLVQRKMPGLQISSILHSLQWSSLASWIMITGSQCWFKMIVCSKLTIHQFITNGHRWTLRMRLHSFRWTKASSKTVQRTATNSLWDTQTIFQTSLHFFRQTIKHMKNHLQTRRFLVWLSHYQQWIKILRLRTVHKMRSRWQITVVSKLWALSRLKSTSQHAKT